MDDLDRKILSLLAKNARMPVKEIAEQVALTSPAVSSRIHKLETDGIISGYTVVLNRPADRVYAGAALCHRSACGPAGCGCRGGRAAAQKVRGCP